MLKTKQGAAHGSRQGITMLEVLVVVGLTAFLASLLLVYSSRSRSQIALSVEVSKVTQAILRAKSLTTAAYIDPTGPCGYGVHFEYGSSPNYSLIEYRLPNVADCSNILSIDPAFEGKLTTFPLRAELKFLDGPSRIDDVIFIPPEPETLVNAGGVILGSGAGNIYLSTADSSASATLSVSVAGQVNF